MKEKSQEIKNILKILQNFLPKKSKILLLSKAGPRFFSLEKGGTLEIYGIFHAQDFWEKISFEKNELKIEIIELKKFLKEAPTQYNALCFAHLGSPVYVHPKFDYHGLRKLFALPACFTRPLFKLRHFNFLIVSDALQFYWDLMWRLHFIKTGQIIFNFKYLKKYYRFPMIEILQKKPPSTPLTSKEKQRIKKDIMKLYKKLQKFQKKQKKSDVVSREWNFWRKKVETTFLAVDT